jgi:hypothetical protein
MKVLIAIALVMLGFGVLKGDCILAVLGGVSALVGVVDAFTYRRPPPGVQTA